MEVQGASGDIMASAVNEFIGDSSFAASSLHAECGDLVGGTVEACTDSPTRCISYDRRTSEVIAGLG